jgi:diacylglycerol kinase (ATP)
MRAVFMAAIIRRWLLVASPALRRADLIVNPISGTGEALRAASVATAVLERSGVRVCQHVTEAAGQARKFAAEIDPECDTIVSVGGDGTLNEVLSGLIRDIPVGLVPIGTANVVSRDLDIPRNPKRSAQLLLDGVARPIDVGRINDRRFIAMVGAGVDGAIVQAIAAARKGPITKLSYVAPTLKALATYKPMPIRVTVDGVRIDEVFHGVFVTNTRNYGAFFSVTPKAAMDDGAFNWAGQTSPRRLALLRFAIAALRWKELPPTAARYGSGRTFVIEAAGPNPVPVEVDGDFFGFLPVTIEILPGAARIIRKAHKGDGGSA